MCNQAVEFSLLLYTFAVFSLLFWMHVFLVFVCCRHCWSYIWFFFPYVCRCVCVRACVRACPCPSCSSQYYTVHTSCSSQYWLWIVLTLYCAYFLFIAVLTLYCAYFLFITVLTILWILPVHCSTDSVLCILPVHHSTDSILCILPVHCSTDSILSILEKSMCSCHGLGYKWLRVEWNKKQQNQYSPDLAELKSFILEICTKPFFFSFVIFFFFKSLEMSVQVHFPSSSCKRTQWDMYTMWNTQMKGVNGPPIPTLAALYMVRPWNVSCSVWGEM